MRRQRQSGTEDFAGLLSEYIKEQLTDSRYYELLASKLYDSGASRRIKKLSVEKLLNAQKLAEFYSDYSKKRYHPNSRELPDIIIPPIMQALAERFGSAGNSSGRYMRAARRTNNKELRELFYTLGETDRRHADVLHSVMQAIKNFD